MFLAREISSLLSSDPSPESPGLISVPHWRVPPGEDAGLNVRRLMLKLLLTSAKRAGMLRAAFPLGCGGSGWEQPSAPRMGAKRENTGSAAASLGLQTRCGARLPQFPSEAKQVPAAELLKICLHGEAEGGGGQGRWMQRPEAKTVVVWLVLACTVLPCVYLGTWHGLPGLCPSAPVSCKGSSGFPQLGAGARCEVWRLDLNQDPMDCLGDIPAGRWVMGSVGCSSTVGLLAGHQCGRAPVLLGDSAGTGRVGLCQAVLAVHAQPWAPWWVPTGGAVSPWAAVSRPLQHPVMLLRSFCLQHQRASPG